MVKYNLDITRVVGHHFYSAKNCPQPMLENDLEIWWKFMEMVESEYDRITTCKDYDFTFTIVGGSDTNTIRASQEANSKLITYQVRISKGGTSEVITLSSIMQGTYLK